MSCHQAVAADRPAIQKLAALAEARDPIPWVRVYAMPDYVFWSHGPTSRPRSTASNAMGGTPIGT